MSLGLSSTTDAVCRAECADCDWTHDRALDAGDDLDAEDNCEIVERVARHHAHKKCEGVDDVADVTVAVDARGEQA
ncbi:hypothetical protein [Natrialba aegyptia]|uniref:Uncharacterized protein n=1 Tax=Natrialba aegyptia DSM 13077 TaxID=1227491 RepID=M0B4L3_9EURY|nr:hypothetical protein [Natrialba aegyptia]ELZ05765.1 hypothetical protein C480_10220 [Natrialba aegyptia DSM 13077]